MSTDKLILGTAQLGLNYGINNNLGKPTLDEGNQILNIAFEKGIRTLDTAGVYGTAHKVIGNYHEKNSNNKFKIITKLPKSFNSSDLELIIKNYLEELNTERIETLMFHSLESYQNHIDEIETFKSDNFYNKIGVSVYLNEEVDCLINDERIDIVQLPFNLFDNVSRRGKVIKLLKDYGKTVHVRSIFLQGLFFKKIECNNDIVNNLKDELIQISLYSKKYKIGISDMAMSYCLNQDNIDMVIFGVESINQLNENIKSANKKLDERLVDQINSINIENHNFLNPSKWTK